MKTIFQIVASLDLGGSERVAINIASTPNTNYAHHIIEVVKGCSVFSDGLKKELREKGITYHCSPVKNRKLAIVLFPFWFVSLYVRLKPDIIHAHTEVPDLALKLFHKIAWMCFWIKPRYVRTIHSTRLWSKWEKLGPWVERYYIKHHSNIAISVSTRDCYVTQYGDPVPPIIYNGLEEVEQKVFPDLKVGKINILFAGRLEYEKGIDELIAVVTALKDDSRFHFTIVGSGRMEQKVKEAFEGFGNVSLYEKIFGLNQYLGSFDYLFMPSNFEGLALMPIEASLAYTPTIINRCPGLKDTLPDDWALAVTDNSVGDFVELISNKLNNYSYDELAQTAHEFASKHFSLSKMQQSYEQFYEERYKR